MVLTLALFTFAAFVLSVLLTPAVRALALRVNLVDAPDNKRKVPKKPIPRIGGIAIAVAYFGVHFGGGIFLHNHGLATHAGFSATSSIAAAALLVFLIGLADDIFSLKPHHKLAGEICAA